MVDLLTGDLTYTLPLMEIPGPSGGYPIALTYKAGIPSLMDASWVGLGWYLNTGSVDRGVNGVPDDWDEGKSYIVKVDEGGSAITGYSIEAGFDIANVANAGAGLQFANGKVHSGFITAQAGIYRHGDSGTGVGLSGRVHTNGNWSFTTSVTRMIGNGIQKYTSGIGISKYGTVINAGMGGPLKTGALGISISTPGTQIRSSLGGSSTSESFRVGSGDYLIGSSTTTRTIPFPGFYIGIGITTTTWNLFATELEHYYGSIYAYNTYHGVTTPGADWFGNQRMDHIMDVVEESDEKSMYDNADQRTRKNAFAYLSKDHYRVNSQGIAKLVKPQSFENGFLLGKSWWQNENAGKRTHYMLSSNDYTQTFNSSTENNFTTKEYSSYIRMDPGSGFQKIYAGSNDEWSSYSTLGHFKDSMNDLLQNNYNASNNRIGQSIHVRYWTNDQIINGVSPGHMQYNDVNRLVHPREAIGAFQVTNANGITYHYSLPVYQYEQFTKNVGNTYTVYDQYVEEIKTHAYATSWLLTGVTGPDYVDVNLNNVIDDDDYGYWVQFDYGHWSSGYLWGNKKVWGTDNFYDDFVDKNQRWGRKDLYYLDHIRTKSHTAYFIKELRDDAKGIRFHAVGENGRGFVYDDEGIFDEVFAEYDIDIPQESTLRLSKILLVKNDQLTTQEIDEDNANTPIANNQSHSIRLGFMKWASSIKYSVFGGFDHRYLSGFFEQRMHHNILDINDLNNDSTIYNKCLRIIDFDYDYSLAKGTPNSNATGHGRLTLNSVSFKGQGKYDYMPPYEFGYVNKGDLDVNMQKEDAWGYYDAVHDTKSDLYQKTLTDNWSLNNIKTPMGSEIEINYESDTYAGQVLPYYHEKLLAKYGGGGGSITEVIRISKDNTNEYRLTFSSGFEAEAWFDTGIQCEIEIDMKAVYGGPPASNDYFCDYDPAWSSCVTLYYKGECTVKSVNASTNEVVVNLKTEPFEFQALCGDPTNSIYYDWNPCGHSIVAGFDDIKIWGPFTGPAKYYGGGLRVKDVILKDQTGQNQSKITYTYEYTDASTGLDIPYGVTLYSPANIEMGGEFIPFKSLLPSPEVMYSQVKVENFGYDHSQNPVLNNYTVHAFDVPAINAHEESGYNPKSLKIGHFFEMTNLQLDATLATKPDAGNDHWGPIKARHSTLVDNLAAMGRPLKTASYNSQGQLLSETEQHYLELDQIHQGVNQETSRYYKMVKDFEPGNTESYNEWLLNSSSILSYPSVLAATETRGAQGTNITSHTQHDFNTGQVLETVTESSTGIQYRTVNLPAYEHYSGMGLKSTNEANAHMLSQSRGSYTYQKKPGSSTWDVIAATAQTWDDSWTYRDFNGTSYSEVNETTHRVWRKKAGYQWQSLLNSDGSYQNFTAFNWSNPGAHASWKKMGEVVKYSRDSRTLESRDFNGLYASSRLGYDDNYVLATASNARFHEIFSSGAESQRGTTQFLESEVQGVGDIHENTSFAHTGEACLRVNTGQYGFYLIGSSTSALNQTQQYQASVWVRTDNKESARLTVLVKDGESTLFQIARDVSDASTVRAGDWYKLTLLIDFAALDLSPGEYIEVTTTSLDGFVYFDDFRLEPYDAAMLSYVYDDATGRLTATLDAENFATVYEYDDAGRLERVKQEFPENGTPGSSDYYPGGFQTVQEYDYNYAPNL